MLYQATHVTKYEYEAPVVQSLNEARLIPRTLPWQHVLETRFHVATFSVFRPHDEFIATATSVVEVLARQDRSIPDVSWEDAQRLLASHVEDEALPAFEFVHESPFVPVSTTLANYARLSFSPGRPLADAALDLCHRIKKDFKYKPKSTKIETPLAEILRQRAGVCQDFAHVMVGALRSLRLAARYVSGYLRSGELGAEASHAWVSVYIPGYGWLDLDPTNDVIPSLGHITLAWGRDYGDVPPFKGISLGGGGHTVDVEVTVKPLERH